MTSIPVNNVNPLVNYSGRADGTGVKTEEAVTETFGKIMNKMSDELTSLSAQPTASKTMESGVAAAKPAETPKSQNTQETGRTEETRGEKNTKPEGNDGKTHVEDKNVEKDAKTRKAEESVQKDGEKLVEDVADEMGVTVEEVEAAMEVLGLTAVDLFDVDNLKQLLLTLTGSSDELSLVTNEELYTNLQNLLGAVEETLDSLQQELGLSREEVDALIEQVASSKEETVSKDAFDSAMVNAAQENDAEGAQVSDGLKELEGLAGAKDYTVSIQRDGETVQLKVKVDDVSGDKSVKEAVTSLPKEAAQNSGLQGEGKMQERGAFEQHKQEGGEAGANLLQMPMENHNHVNEAQALPQNTYQMAQTEDIMNQITEYMKINLKADVQEMEMRLHPASLGTVNVQIAAREGVITAQFTAQNELVRGVIESQLVQLKEQFEEQGIKVEAVEVTVANHQYGEQNSPSGEEMQQEQKKSGKSVRRINLDEFDEEADFAEMEEADRISVEMMRQNGSTVDYTA